MRKWTKTELSAWKYDKTVGNGKGQGKGSGSGSQHWYIPHNGINYKHRKKSKRGPSGDPNVLRQYMVPGSSWGSGNAVAQWNGGAGNWGNPGRTVQGKSSGRGNGGKSSGKGGEKGFWSKGGKSGKGW